MARSRSETQRLAQAIIVMAADPAQPSDAEIATRLGCSALTVYRVRTRHQVQRPRGRPPIRPSAVFVEQVGHLARLIDRGKLYEIGEVRALARLMRLAIGASLRLDGGGSAATAARALGETLKAGGAPAHRKKWQRAWLPVGATFGDVTLDFDPFAAALFWWAVSGSDSWAGDASPASWPTVALMMLVAEAPDREWISDEEGRVQFGRLTPARKIAARKKYQTGVERRLAALCDDPATAEAARAVMRWGGMSPRG